MRSNSRSQIFRTSLLLLLALLLAAAPQAEALVDEVIDVIHVAKDIASIVLKSWDIAGSYNEKLELPELRDRQRKVLMRLQEVNRRIEQMELAHAKQLTLAAETLDRLTDNNVPISIGLHEIQDTINRITARYQQMQRYESHRNALETETLVKFAEWTVSPNAYAIDHLLNRLHFRLIGTNDDKIDNSLLSKILLYYEAAYESKCELQSVQQFIYSLYTDIALTEWKGYCMMQFSWMMLRVYGRGNFTEEAALMRADYEKRSLRTIKLMREVMRRSDRTIWRCDPSAQKVGQTYEEITKLLQGYIENEVDMSVDESCREDCPTYTLARSHGCFKGFCNKQKSCSGKIHDCQFVDSDMWVCQAPSNSTRRYDYIQYESGTVLGKIKSCQRATSKVESWRRWLIWRCSYCFCLCDEQGLKSDRFFNLRETISNIDENRVVTGLRFVKKNRVIHLQIQEGELLPRGIINLTTLMWKPLENYNIFDREVRNGKDYHTLSYESRSIDLDDIHTDDQSFIVTGVRFRVLGAHLNLEVHFSEFDFVKGKLIEPHNGFWKSNDNTDVSGIRREKIQLIKPDIPIRSMMKSAVNSKDNQYVDFVNSNMYSDAAQTTVPFIDIQDVISNTPVPLSGAGVYHKGGVGSGGFIAPKIITYDFAPHIKELKSDIN